MTQLWGTYGVALTNAWLFIALFFVIGLWLVSAAMRDSSIVDIFWAPTSAVVAWIAYLSSPGAEPRATLVVTLATLWGLRMGLYIGIRNWGAEDRRYARLRQHITDQGKNYLLYSFRAVFMLQGFSSAVTTLPLVVGVATPSTAGLGPLAWAGAAAWLVGFVVESIADFQMARFRANRTPGQVMDRGLWRYSRHPNYFGEMLIQWGFFLIACDAGWVGLITIAGPLMLSYLIIGPMGANLLERRLTKKNPDYSDYIARTSAFIPWPPKKA